MLLTDEIATDSGPVRGERGRYVSRWRAIPYAAPPVDELRFRAPQPVQAWSRPRDATMFGHAAVQSQFGARIGVREYQPMSEDALTINITVPKGESALPRPVIVFIHGGGYTFGTSALGLYSGTRLALAGDVVFVSFNYRLGAFGYLDFSELSTPERIFESNLGLRDQVAALEWVQRNIAAFGGDPDNVTIMGESAGAHAVIALLATPAAKGLFHRAISQSAPADWGMSAADAREFGRQCVQALGVRPDEAAKVLSTADAHDLRRVVGRQLRVAYRERPGLMPIAPVIDGSYLPELPLAAIANGHAHPVPLLIGTNLDEGTLFAKHLDELPTNPKRLELMFSQAGLGSGERIKAAYPKYPQRSAAVRMGGDYVFRRPTFTACEGHSSHAPTYVYRYDFATPTMKLLGYGATHASELLAVFGFGDTAAGQLLTATGGRAGLRQVTRMVQGHWTHFARTGAPRPDWPTYTPTRRNTVIIDAPSRVVLDPDQTIRIAWDGVPPATM